MGMGTKYLSSSLPRWVAVSPCSNNVYLSSLSQASIEVLSIFPAHYNLVCQCSRLNVKVESGLAVISIGER